MAPEKLKVLLDTNVWLDYFIDRSATHDLAHDMVAQCIRKDVCLLAATSSLKDCFFLVAQELKRIERAENGEVSQLAANAIAEVAWSCVSSMRKLAYVVPADDTDIVEAMMLRSSHQDFEDNLVVAAAMRSQADIIVTSDKALIAHSPVKCATVQEALGLLMGKQAAR